MGYPIGDLGLWRVGGDVFQGAEDGLRDWGSGGKVIALRLEAVFIGDVGQ